MTQVEKRLSFDPHTAAAAPSAQAIKAVVLLAALLVYAAGFAILYPIVASSVATSAAESDGPALTQFVGP